MGFDLNPVLFEAERNGAIYRIIDPLQTRADWAVIAEKYARSRRYTFQFWDQIDDALTVETDDGWSVVSRLIATLHDVHLYFELDDEATGVIFPLGLELASALTEVGSRDFYLTTRDFDFLLSYTDHNRVLAVGRAKEWLGAAIAR